MTLLVFTIYIGISLYQCTVISIYTCKDISFYRKKRTFHQLLHILTVFFDLRLYILNLQSVSTSAYSFGQGRKTIEADELKDEKGGVFYRYDLEGVGSVILRDWKDWEFKIITESGEFDSFEMNDEISHGIFYTFGYYNDDNKLEFKFKDDRLEVDHNNKKSAWINKKWTHDFYNKNKIKKAFCALKEGKGYVRIVYARKSAPDFDLKVTPYNL